MEAILKDYKTLRFARLNDIDELLDIAVRFAEGSSYSYMSIDRAKARRELERFIIEGQKDFLVLLSVDGDKIVGGLVAYAFKPLFSNDRIACECFMYLDEEYRNSHRGSELMDAYEYWAKMVGCKAVQYGILETSPKGMASLYDRRGNILSEHLYYKELK